MRCSTSCAPATRASRSSLARPAARASPSASSTAPTACGRRTAAALETPGPVRLPGISGTVTVTALNEPAFADNQRPPWMAEGLTTTGEALGRVGLQMPVLHPEQALLLVARRV